MLGFIQTVYIRLVRLASVWLWQKLTVHDIWLVEVRVCLVDSGSIAILANVVFQVPALVLIEYSQHGMLLLVCFHLETNQKYILDCYILTLRLMLMLAWLKMKSFYLHTPDVEGLTLADEDLSDQSRGDVPRCVHCTVVQSCQTSRVCFRRLVLVDHSPYIGVCLTWLNSMRLVAWQTHYICKETRADWTPYPSVQSMC